MKYNPSEVKYSLTKKLFIGLVAIGLVVGIILSCLSYHYTKKYIFDLSSSLTTSCAVDVANMMYNSPIDKFLKGEEKALYENNLKAIQNIANTFGLKYLYVYVPDTKNNKLISIFGVEGQNGKVIPGFNLGESPKRLKLNNKVMSMYNRKSSGLVMQIDNEYGHVLTSYATVVDNKSNPIAIVGADIDFGYITYNLKKDISITFISIFCTLTLILLLVMQYIKKTFIKPLLKLSNEMKNMICSDNGQYKPITLDTNDEFNSIAGMYNIMSKEKIRMSSELSIGRTIQLSSLPSKFPPYPEHSEFEIYASTLPAKEVGGDFYDFFFINESKFMFLIADVSGKGIPAALFMMTTKTLIKSIASEDIPPEKLIYKINKLVSENNEQGFFVTFFATIVDIKTGQTYFINGGHNPPAIKRANNSAYEYMKIPSNLVLGVVNDFKYKIEETVLNKGDILFLYTDGVSEALNEDNVLYGETKLLNTLNLQPNEDNSQKIVERVYYNVKEFAGETEQSDDITMLVFKYNG